MWEFCWCISCQLFETTNDLSALCFTCKTDFLCVANQAKFHHPVHIQHTGHSRTAQANPWGGAKMKLAYAGKTGVEERVHYLGYFCGTFLPLTWSGWVGSLCWEEISNCGGVAVVVELLQPWLFEEINTGGWKKAAKLRASEPERKLLCIAACMWTKACVHGHSPKII